MSTRRVTGFVTVFAATLPLITPSAQTRALSEEGQAFISETEARLVFPGSWTRSLRWGVPRKDANPLSREFLWSVEWPARYIVDGRDPQALWLNIGWKSGGPSPGTLAKLIAKTPLEAMINCVTCDLMLFAMPERDTTEVFAAVENGRLVFNVRGREAVKRIFPKIPDRVTFGQITPTYTLPGYPEQATSKQTVLVNCRAGSSAPASRSCLVVPVVRKLPPNADSAAAENAPRHLFGSVASFSDAIAIPDVDVAIRTTDGKIWKTVSTGKSMFVVLQAPVGHLLLVALCPRRLSPTRAPFGTLALEMRPRLDTQVTIMTDLRLCSSRAR